LETVAITQSLSKKKIFKEKNEKFIGAYYPRICIILFHSGGRDVESFSNKNWGKKLYGSRKG
jgi:hypothetical protein